MAFLFRKEEDDAQLSYAAQSLLDRVRNGMSVSQAAAAGNIDDATLRQWQRNPAFRAAIHRNKNLPPYDPARWLNMDTPPDGPVAPEALSPAQQMLVERIAGTWNRGPTYGGFGGSN